MPECLATFRGLDIVCKDERISAELHELPARNPILAVTATQGAIARLEIPSCQVDVAEGVR